MLIERKYFKNEAGELEYLESIFNSDNVLKTTYFPSLKRLYIAFIRGGTYSYQNIDFEFYMEFEKADSQGKFFHKKINPYKDKYPFRKEFTLYPYEVKEIKEIIVESLKKKEDEQ